VGRNWLMTMDASAVAFVPRMGRIFLRSHSQSFVLSCAHSFVRQKGKTCLIGHEHYF